VGPVATASPPLPSPGVPPPFLPRIPGATGVRNPAHPPSFKPFGTPVALGVYIGSVLCMRNGKERGIPEKRLSEFIFWVVGIGFIGQRGMRRCPPAARIPRGQRAVQAEPFVST